MPSLVFNAPRSVQLALPMAGFVPKAIDRREFRVEVSATTMTEWWRAKHFHACHAWKSLEDFKGLPVFEDMLVMSRPAPRACDIQEFLLDYLANKPDKDQPCGCREMTFQSRYRL